MAQTGDQLRDFLAGRDVPCPACGYNLRGLAAPVCPECGLTLTVEGIRRSLRQRGGAAVVLAGIGVLMFAVIALPTGTFVLLMAAGMMLGEAVVPAAASAAVLFGLGITGLLLFLGPLVVAKMWDTWEARVTAMPRMTRWGVAALCWSWIVVPFGAIAVL